MGKSRFLEELISNKEQPITNNMIDKIWETGDLQTNTISYDITESLSSNSQILTSGDTWLNALDVYSITNNYSVRDTSLVNIDQITTQLSAIPVITNHTHDYKFSKKRDLPGNYVVCKITSIKGESQVSIPVLFPRSFSRSISASFTRNNPVGSSKANMAYAYTDSEQIPISFDCLSEYLPEGFNSLTSYIDAIMNILKPKYSSNVVQEPRVKLEFAGLTFNCVCTQVSVDYDMLFDSNSFVHATVQAQFTTI